MYLVYVLKNARISKLKKGRKRCGELNTYMRPLCKCGMRPCAINYKKQGKTYYRKLCEACLKHGLNYGVPRWYRTGYRMQDKCDKCGFKSKHKSIFRVFHIDGNLENCRRQNLKTVCANCRIELAQEGSSWKQGDLIADF